MTAALHQRVPKLRNEPCLSWTCRPDSSPDVGNCCVSHKDVASRGRIFDGSRQCLAHAVRTWKTCREPLYLVDRMGWQRTANHLHEYGARRSLTHGRRGAPRSFSCHKADRTFMGCIAFRDERHTGGAFHEGALNTPMRSCTHVTVGFVEGVAQVAFSTLVSSAQRRRSVKKNKKCVGRHVSFPAALIFESSGVCVHHARRGNDQIFSRVLPLKGGTTNDARNVVMQQHPLAGCAVDDVPVRPNLSQPHQRVLPRPGIRGRLDMESHTSAGLREGTRGCPMISCASETRSEPSSIARPHFWNLWSGMGPGRGPCRTT